MGTNLPVGIRGAASANSGSVACSIRDLSVRFPTRDGRQILAVDSFSLDIPRGDVIGIVGESGSGKSMLSLAVLNLVPAPGVVTGSLLVGDVNVLAAKPKELTTLRGRTVGLVLQDPSAALNPVRTIRSQMVESARHAGIAKADIPDEVAESIRSVHLDPSAVLGKYPFELSGGMNQRVAIAMALVQRPQILIADEPTTALDATTQVDTLAVLCEAQRSRHMTMILISHDLGLVYQVADRIAVMYSGRLVEAGLTRELVDSPAHAYTRDLFQATPSATVVDQPLRTIPGQLRTRYVGEAGCPYASRCSLATDVCRTTAPAESAVSETHRTWCWHADEVAVRQ